MWPEHDIFVLWSHLRQRKCLNEYRAAHIQHMQKSLMQMKVQIHHAVSDITGVTGLKNFKATVSSGEQNHLVTPFSMNLNYECEPGVSQEVAVHFVKLSC